MFISVKKRTLIAIAAALAVIAVGITAVTTVSLTDTAFAATSRKLPVYRVDRGEEKVVALSFDAAWGADKTQGILDILGEYQAKATFFLVGFWVDKFADEVKKIDAEGHEIGNHSKNHLKMSTLSEADIHTELDYVNDAVSKLTGKTCKVFRPPFGDYNDALINTVTNKGMMGIQWDVDSLDWKGISADEIVKRVCGRVKPGSIVLFHNNSDHILGALPKVLLTLKNQGYRFVTMSELIYKDNYSIDNNGEQHRIKE